MKLSGLGKSFSERRDVDNDDDDDDDDSKLFTFVTRPDIKAPKWRTTTHNASALSPGHWFVAPYAHLDQKTYPLWNGPHIYNGAGDLLWSGAPQFSHRNTFDFRTVEYRGQEEAALSLIDPANEHRAGVVLDARYGVLATVDLRGEELERTNMHDFTVVGDGAQALTLTRVPGRSSVEESAAVGFDGECRAGWEGFKEVEVETSRTLFEWDAHGHIGLDESTKYPPDDPDARRKMCENGWDILHLNSIDKFPDGDYLLSSRHTDTLYKISHHDGRILWRLGGPLSDFTTSAATHFSRQHHARVHSQNETHTLLTVFDNASGDGPHEVPSNPMSRGLLLSLQTSTMQAEMLGHYDHPHHRIANSRGSLQFLPNGNAFACFTYGSAVAEYSAEGELLMEAEFELGKANTYRAYKFPWVGRPEAPPDVVAVVERAGWTSVWVSWNGATEVAGWRVFEAEAGKKMKKKRGGVVEEVEWQGFESRVDFEGYAPFVVAEAYDANGEVLGTSDPVSTVAGPGVVLIDAGNQSGNASAYSSILQDRDPVSLVLSGALLGAVACLVVVLVWRYFRSTKSRLFGWGRKEEEETEYKPLAEGEEDDEGEEEVNKPLNLRDGG